LAPLNTKALAVLTKVKEGRITSSPGWISMSIRRPFPSASVQEVGKKTLVKTISVVQNIDGTDVGIFTIAR
jgi:hypothetical protein